MKMSIGIFVIIVTRLQRKVIGNNIGMLKLRRVITMKNTKYSKREERAIKDFLLTLQEGFLEDEGVKYSLKELRKRFDYEIQQNIIARLRNGEDRIW
jgi:hypothetical protein